MDKPRLVPLMARLPKDLHANLVARAKESGRSLNAEIIQRLDPKVSQDDLVEMIRSIARVANARS